MKRNDEAWAAALLKRIVDRSVQDRDALPGKVVEKCKQALTILRKRRQA